MSESLILQMCELARQQKGLALVFLIEKVLTNPKIFVFGELLSLPSVQALRADAAGSADGNIMTAGESAATASASMEGRNYNAKAGSKSYRTLELFAYGTYRDYAMAPEQYTALTPAMVTKLKQLSLVSLAVESKVLPYARLQDVLAIESVRELEDLIISTVYCGLVRGKMNQQQSSLSVQQFIGRDVRPADISKVVSQLQAFQSNCLQQASIVQASTKIISDKRDLEAGHMQAVISNVRDNKNNSIGGSGGSRRAMLGGEKGSSSSSSSRSRSCNSMGGGDIDMGGRKGGRRGHGSTALSSSPEFDFSTAPPLSLSASASASASLSTCPAAIPLDAARMIVSTEDEE